jgi:hypothetical protein
MLPASNRLRAAKDFTTTTRAGTRRSRGCVVVSGYRPAGATGPARIGLSDGTWGTRCSGMRCPAGSVERSPTSWQNSPTARSGWCVASPVRRVPRRSRTTSALPSPRCGLSGHEGRPRPAVGLGPQHRLGPDVGPHRPDPRLPTGDLPGDAAHVQVPPELLDLRPHIHPSAWIRQGPSLGRLATTAVQPLERWGIGPGTVTWQVAS